MIHYLKHFITDKGFLKSASYHLCFYLPRASAQSTAFVAAENGTTFLASLTTSIMQAYNLQAQLKNVNCSRRFRHKTNKQLLDEDEHDIMNYQNRGLCYLPKPKAEADNTDTRF